MRQTGFAELSGLCTHPDFQRRGLRGLALPFRSWWDRGLRRDRLSACLYYECTGHLSMRRWIFASARRWTCQSSSGSRF